MLFPFPGSAHAQGCSSCYNNAAQADAHQRRALKQGILILGIPAALMLGGIGLAAYRSDREQALKHEDGSKKR